MKTYILKRTYMYVFFQGKAEETQEEEEKEEEKEGVGRRGVRGGLQK